MTNPLRSALAVIAGVAVISLVVQSLEFTLVNAVADAPVRDMAGYFAVANRPSMLAAKLGYQTLAAILGGYLTAKIAESERLKHGALAAAVQTTALVWGFTAGEYAAFTPVWMRVALVVVTGPAMLAGAWVRAQAAQILDNSPREEP
ncbi:MAG: hypothetical protein FJW14_06820 [Acidimicrobiia bacterium]|nr:hypothetical protein [Acidimicrobiia bacterium]